MAAASTSTRRRTAGSTTADEPVNPESEPGPVVPAEAVPPGPRVVAGMAIVPVENASIHVLMGRILAEMPAIGKTQRNEQQGFMFRGIDDVLNALNPLLGKYGVFYVPDVLDRVTSQRTTRNGGIMYEVNLHVRYTFYGPTGDSVSASAWGEGTDNGDKSTPKAMTNAQKNALFQCFCISTKEQSDNDADRTTPEETVDPDAHAKEFGWADRATQKAAHDSLTADVRESVEKGLLTAVDRDELKSLGYGWPMRKAEYDDYRERARVMVEANAAAAQQESFGGDSEVGGDGA